MNAGCLRLASEELRQRAPSRAEESQVRGKQRHSSTAQKATSVIIDSLRHPAL